MAEPSSPSSPDPLKALDAVRRLVEILRELQSPDEQGRALAWAGELLGIARDVPSANRSSGVLPSQDRVITSSAPTAISFETVGELMAAADPSTEADRALVMGYWVQVVGQQPDFDAQSINSELKHLGHGIGNITLAFNSLMARRPQLVIQTKKQGTARQARKRYKLTTAGVQFVEQMAAQNGGAL